MAVLNACRPPLHHLFFSSFKNKPPSRFSLYNADNKVKLVIVNCNMASRQVSKETGQLDIHKKPDASGVSYEEGVKASSSPEELTKYRQMAQQNSIEAIRAAELRYAEAKESAAMAGGDHNANQQ